MIEPSKDIPVLYDVDVVVCGGGMAGCIAAIAAARYGASVCIVEKFGQLGGNIGPGNWSGGIVDFGYNVDTGKPSLAAEQGLGGIAAEFLERVVATWDGGKGVPVRELPGVTFKQEELVGSGGGVGPGFLVDALNCSQVLLEMLREAGVKTLLSTTVADPIIKEVGWRGNTHSVVHTEIRGVYIETRSGRMAIKAKVTIDNTGQADIAYRAGAPCKNQMHPNLGLWFLIDGVDWEKYNAYRDKANKTPLKIGGIDLEWARGHMAPSDGLEDPYPRMHDLIVSMRVAWTMGEFQFRVPVPEDASVHFMFDNTEKGNEQMHMQHDLGGMMGARTGTMGKIDFTDPVMVSKMEEIHREQPYKLAKFLRKYIPGFEKCYLMFCSPLLGTRGGRHIDAEYPISMDDVVNARKFDDVIYSSFEYKRKTECDMPYRALIPKCTDGLMVVGTGSMPYPPNFRRRAYMLLQGQAAGLASALCVESGLQPRLLPIKKLQKILVNDLNCPIGDAARLKELGLR